MSGGRDAVLQATFQVLGSNSVWVIGWRSEGNREVVVHRVKEQLHRLGRNGKAAVIVNIPRRGL
jgi:hypothetical protein